MNVLNGQAQYYTKTDSLGNYTFKNLPPNAYRVYAFEDKNNNNKADSDGEFYGFYTDTVKLQDNVTRIDFTIQQLGTKELRLLSGRQFGRYFELNFNKAITSFQPIEDKYVYMKKDDETIRFYRTDQILNDTTNLIFQAEDSVGNLLIDTAAFYFSESDIEPDAMKQNLSPSNTALKPAQPFHLTFDKPIIILNYDSITYSLDSLNTFPFPKDEVSAEAFNTSLTWNLIISDYIKRPGQELTLEIKEGGFSFLSMRIRVKESVKPLSLRLQMKPH